ncbi:MAG: hypothetical protein CMK64_03510 [Pseudoalteromonas sp.]|nr:hypothetical protein [Pseudoalteromonas sp.]|tara:strand:+ start:192 stop:1115 length:924 start_codon:yes stop_codon:yes gene_type:complete
MKKPLIAIAVIGTIAAGYGVTQYKANEKLNDEIAKQISLFEESSGFTVDYKEANYSLLNKEVNLQDIKFKGPEGEDLATISQIIIEGYETDKISPYTAMDLKGLRFAQQLIDLAEPTTPTELLNASYDITSSLKYDEATGKSDFDIGFVAGEVAAMEMAFTLGNSKTLMDVSLESQKMQMDSPLTMEQELQLQSKMMMAMQELQPQSFNFSFNNKGQFESVVEQQLSAVQLDKLTFVQQAQMQVDMLPLDEASKVELMNFVNGLNSLNISMQLDNNKAVSELAMEVSAVAQQPEKLAQLLNLKIKGS